MQNKQRARQLAEQQSAREAKAFLQNPRARLEPCTVPEPFALQTELREVGLSPPTDGRTSTGAGLKVYEQRCSSRCCGMRYPHTFVSANSLECSVTGCVRLTQYHDTVVSSSCWGMFTWLQCIAAGDCQQKGAATSQDPGSIHEGVHIPAQDQ